MKMTVSLSDEFQKTLAGRYINEDRNQVINLRIEEGKLLVGENMEMIPVDENEFRMSGSTTRYIIEVKTDDEESLSIAATGIEGIRVFTKMDTWEPGAPELSRYTGIYRSDETDSIMRFSVDDEGTLEVHHRWIGTAPMEPLAEDIFRAGNGMMIEFIKDESGNTSGFYANSGRTLKVWFGRE